MPGGAAQPEREQAPSPQVQYLGYAGPFIRD